VASVCATMLAAPLLDSTHLANAGTVPCGVSTVVGPNGASWHCSFDDEFSGPGLDGSKWYVQTTYGSGFTDGTSCFTNNKHNVSVANGVLTLTVYKTPAPFTCQSPAGAFTTQYAAGEVATLGRFSQTYGRFSINAAFPATAQQGLQSSLWLYPVDGTKYGTWPRSGEIDIAEEYSRYNDRAIPYVHYAPAAPDPYVTNTMCLIADVSAFHTYTVDWTPTTIRISFDGQQCLSDRWNPQAPLVAPQPFDSPFMVALTAAIGSGGNALTSTTPFPQATKINWVRVWG
jgi:beta-glucanase (GH16 family)